MNGGRIIATQGQSKVHWAGFSARPGYSSTEELPSYITVKEYT